MSDELRSSNATWCSLHVSLRSTWLTSHGVCFKIYWFNCSLHISYVREFSDPSESACLLRSRGVQCWNLNTAPKWRMLWWKHSLAIRKRKLKRNYLSTSRRLSVWCVGPSWASNTSAKLRKPTSLKHEFCGTRQVNLELKKSEFINGWLKTVFPLSSIQASVKSPRKSLPSSEPQAFSLSRMSHC